MSVSIEPSKFDMIFKKLMATILAVGVLVFGSLQLGKIPMPAAHNLCGAWG